MAEKTGMQAWDVPGTERGRLPGIPDIPDPPGEVIGCRSLEALREPPVYRTLGVIAGTGLRDKIRAAGPAGGFWFSGLLRWFFW